jgi:hypothetical protein
VSRWRAGAGSGALLLGAFLGAGVVITLLQAFFWTATDRGRREPLDLRFAALVAAWLMLLALGMIWQPAWRTRLGGPLAFLGLLLWVQAGTMAHMRTRAVGLAFAYGGGSIALVGLGLWAWGLVRRRRGELDEAVE